MVRAPRRAPTSSRGVSAPAWSGTTSRFGRATPSGRAAPRSRRRCPSTGSSGSGVSGRGAHHRSRPARRLATLAQRGAAGAPAGGGERPARRRRSRRQGHPGGTARTPRARGLLQRHERQADQGAGDRAGVPPLGQPRAQDAAHLHPRLRRGHRRRDRRSRTTAPTSSAPSRAASSGWSATFSSPGGCARVRSPCAGRSVDLAAVAEDVARRYEATARDAGLTLLVSAEAGGARGRRPRPRAPGRLQPGRERDPLHAGAGNGDDHHGAGRPSRSRTPVVA